MQTRRLLRIELTVADLAAAEKFYAEALGFVAIGREDLQPGMAALLGGGRVRQVMIRRGEQHLALQAFEPGGAPYPAGSTACDQVFQHIALPVEDMPAAYSCLLPHQGAAISSGGPQQLPESSGGATAYKFRDPDGHPLELIRFANGAPGGIDHSAIAVLDVERSMAFYCGQLGFRVGARQVNTGAAQDRLDGLHDARVDVVALQPQHPTPHVELLAYRTPVGRAAAPKHPCDIAATRLVMEVTGLPEPATVLADGSRAALVEDPDGHLLILLEPRMSG